MGELSSSGEKDPYMQAYITARMKNQVEEMKLQKTLSTMEVSQRVRKIIINLELFEDRKTAHRLQQEVKKATKRQDRAKIMFDQKASRQQRTSAWTSEHAHSLAHDLGSITIHGLPYQPHDHAVYPVTSAGQRSHTGARLPDLGLPAVGREAGSARAGQRQKPGRRAVTEDGSMPLIQVTDCSQDSGVSGSGGLPLPATEAAPPVTMAPPSTKTAIIVTPPPLSGTSRPPPPPPPQPSSVRPSRPATEPCAHGSPSASVYFPPVARARSTRTRYARSTSNTALNREDGKRRLTSASSHWPGDPRAICSVRRDRRGIEEMLASVKSGEETRRLIREAVPTCSRNCSKPNILLLMERTYVDLPNLLPEIEKARTRMRKAGKPQDRLPLTSAEKRKSVGRFELEEEQNLPVCHIDYSKLREIGGTRRNSVLA